MKERFLFTLKLVCFGLFATLSLGCSGGGGGGDSAVTVEKRAIDGLAFSDSGDPLAEVSISLNEVQRDTVTGSAGEFAFENLQVFESYSLDISGYQSASTIVLDRVPSNAERVFVSFVVRTDGSGLRVRSVRMAMFDGSILRFSGRVYFGPKEIGGNHGPGSNGDDFDEFDPGL